MTNTSIAAPQRWRASNKADNGRRRLPKSRYRLPSFLFTLPTVALFTLFFLWPAVLGLVYSLTDYRGWGEANFIGLENYTNLFADEDFYSSLIRTFQYIIVCVPLGYCLSLAMALVLTSKGAKGKAVARTIFFLPWLVSSIVAGVIWGWLFGEDFGFVNYVIELLGGEKVAWSTSANLSLSVVVFAAVWCGAAFNMLLFVNAINNVPTSYYEAAQLDGANAWQQFRHITLPSILPTSVLVILLSTMSHMKEYSLLQALNEGGPGTSNRLIVQYIYETGFGKSNVGYASAASMVLFVILMVIGLAQLRISSKKGAW